MTEKISIFDVEISCIKAKEAMMQAIGFMKGDSINTIELVSMESLMKEHENPEWKKKVSMQDLVLPGSVEILEAAKTDDARLLRETDDKLFLRMFLKYLQKNHHKIYLLAASQEELVKAEEALAKYNQGIRVVGDAVIHPEDGELTDADRIHGIVNAVNGSEANSVSLLYSEILSLLTFSLFGLSSFYRQSCASELIHSQSRLLYRSMPGSAQ